MSRGIGEWLANARVDQLVWTCLAIAAALGGIAAFGFKWRHDRRQP